MVDFQVKEIKLSSVDIFLIHWVEEQIKSCATHLSGSRQSEARLSSSNNGTKQNLKNSTFIHFIKTRTPLAIFYSPIPIVQPIYRDQGNQIKIRIQCKKQNATIFYNPIPKPPSLLIYNKTK